MTENNRYSNTDDSDEAAELFLDELDSKLTNMGRPRSEIDYDLLESLLLIHCSQEECASVFGISIDTLNTRCKEQYNKTFSEHSKQYRNIGKVSLRRKQIRKALRGDGDTQMLKHLGKHYLDQRDEINVNNNISMQQDISSLVKHKKQLMQEHEAENTSNED